MSRARLVLALAVVLAFPAVPALAACDPVPPRSSPAGRLRIRLHPIVVLGTIGAPPSDPHGEYSLTLNVKRYYAGKGPLTITITNYGTKELHEGFERPRNPTSTQNSREFLRRFGGKQAVFFLKRPDDALGRDVERRYADQYATDACLYNVVGDDVRLFRPLLDQIFSQPPPAPGATGLPAPGGQPSAVPTGTGKPLASAKAEEGRSGPIARAGALVLIVGAALLLFRSPRSPLFERWRAS